MLVTNACLQAPDFISKNMPAKVFIIRAPSAVPPPWLGDWPVKHPCGTRLSNDVTPQHIQSRTLDNFQQLGKASGDTVKSSFMYQALKSKDATKRKLPLLLHFTTGHQQTPSIQTSPEKLCVITHTGYREATAVQYNTLDQAYFKDT